MPRFAIDLLVVSLFIAAIYAFIILPRQLQFKRTQKYVAEEITPGDEIVTYGGMVGIVQDVEIEKGVVHLEIAEGVTIRIITASIASRYDPERLAKDAQAGLGQMQRDPRDTEPRES